MIGRLGTLAILIGLLVAGARMRAAAAGGLFYGSASQVDWSSLATIDHANLDACFRGTAPCAPTTDARWRAYPQRLNGEAGGELYNGCYRYRGRNLQRYSGLGTDGSCACPDGGADCPQESLVRVFVGYQTFCPSGAPTPCPAGGEVRVNCSLETLSLGAGVNQIGYYVQNCAEGRPLRLSRSMAVVQASPAPGCPAGQQPSGGGCAPCLTGTYKEHAGNFACSACPAAGVPNASGASYATTPASGAIEPTACALSYACLSGFTQGTNPAAYSETAGYDGASCLAAAPSPTPTPTVTPPGDYFLVGGVHKPEDCHALGGMVVYERVLDSSYLGTGGSLPADNGFCKFAFPTPSNTNACPSGWQKFRDYRSTVGAYTTAAYVQSYAKSPYAGACPIPSYAGIIGANVTEADRFFYGPAAEAVSSFRNGPSASVSVSWWTYFDMSCSGSPTPNPPAQPAGGGFASQEYERHLRNARRGVDDLFDILFPSAHAKFQCSYGNTLACRETNYSKTVTLETREIGCY